MENPHQPQTHVIQENSVSHSNKNPSLLMLLSGVVLVTALIAGGMGYYLGSMPKNQNYPTPGPDQTVCTMEAKLCADGSSVGRSGPNCEFAACPSTPAVSSEPQASDNLKHISLDLVANTRGETRSYTYDFDYPTAWNLTTSVDDHKNDDLVTGCQDYSLISPATNLSIKLICTGWSGKATPIPQEYVTVANLGKKGNDASDQYIIRFLDMPSNTYKYGVVFVQPGETLAAQKEVQEGVLVDYAPDDHYFIPTMVSVTTTSPNELILADQIVKSLSLKAK